MDVVLIPAYQPDNSLIKLVDELYENKFTIVVVNDGSGEKYQDVFSAIDTKTHIVTLEKNSGKGAALKAGMRYIKDCLPECQHFITCDADGQHRPADVVRVREQLHKGNRFVLTVRQRKGKIPFRSRFGNDLSKVVYTLLTNRYLSDNQSGLRGFARSNLEWLIEVEKNNYDYEMNVLYYAAKMGLKITTIPIDAIYIADNASSHFNPIVDTLKIYKSLFSLAMGTIISFILVEALMLVATFLSNNNYISFVVPSIGAISLFANIMFTRIKFLKRVPIGEYITTTVYTVIFFFIYTLMCMLMAYAFPNSKLFFNFNLTYLTYIPLKYFFHKLIFIGSITKD